MVIAIINSNRGSTGPTLSSYNSASEGAYRKASYRLTATNNITINSITVDMWKGNGAPEYPQVCAYITAEGKTYESITQTIDSTMSASFVFEVPVPLSAGIDFELGLYLKNKGTGNSNYSTAVFRGTNNTSNPNTISNNAIVNQSAYQDVMVYDSKVSIVSRADAKRSERAYMEIDFTLNATPTVNLSAPTDAQTLYENTAYTISGNATDADNGNIVNIRYSINDGTARALATGISDGATAIPFAKTLTFKNGKLFDGSTAITDTLAEGTAHMLRVWATDDQGATSTIISRSFYAVPNRAPALTLDTPQPAGTIGSDKFTISGQASDIDGNDVVVTYRINSGLAKEIYRGQGAPFSFEVALKDLAVGSNDIIVEVSDTYAFKATKTVRIRKNEVKTAVTAGTVRYKVAPPKGSAKGFVIWVQRDANLTIDASVSAQLTGEQEAYVAMTKTTTAPVNDSTFEDEFIYEATEPKTDIMLKFELNGTGAIKLITGAID